MGKELIIRRQQSTAQDFTEDLGDGIGLDMVLIPSGSFWMGTEDEEIERLVKEYKQEWFREEKPQHKVNISRFFLGRYPITQAQWRIVAGWERVGKELDSDPSDFKEDYEGIERWLRPVENVSWEDAQEFCARLSKRTKREYRLPTEAEWEYACRSVTSEDLTVEEWNEKYNQPFHFGETISTDLANYQGKDDEIRGWKGSYGRGAKGEYRKQTTPVGYFKVANNFGLYDMHGNVWEWCEDNWHNNYQNAPTDGSAWLSGASNNRVVRGGSWDLYPVICRSAFREYDDLDYRDDLFGFRVVSVIP